MKIMRGEMQAPATANEVDRPAQASRRDERLVERVKAGDLSAFELLVRRHNQRLYRAIRSVLRTGEEVEDAMQDSYFAALKHIDQFEGRAQFGTWLLKIGINEARARLRRRVRLVALDDVPGRGEARHRPWRSRTPCARPSSRWGSHEIIAVVEAAIDRLPDDYRQVLVLRMVDALDTAETAEVLGPGRGRRPAAPPPRARDAGEGRRATRGERHAGRVRIPRPALRPDRRRGDAPLPGGAVEPIDCR